MCLCVPHVVASGQDVCKPAFCRFNEYAICQSYMEARAWYQRCRLSSSCAHRCQAKHALMFLTRYLGMGIAASSVEEEEWGEVEEEVEAEENKEE